LYDGIISLREEIWTIKTSLRIIAVPVPSQENVRLSEQIWAMNIDSASD